PDRVQDLEERGIAFDRSPDGSLHLSLEGGHKRRRVVHAGGSATGRHPTALRIDGELDGFLVTEAVRGEGALLVDAAGERFVDELAPRDAVARAIDARL